MSKTTIEQFCQYLVAKYLLGKSYQQVVWSDIYQRVERQNLTVIEEFQVRDFVAGENKRMVFEENQRRREQARKNQKVKTLASLGLA